MKLIILSVFFFTCSNITRETPQQSVCAITKIDSVRQFFILTAKCRKDSVKLFILDKSLGNCVYSKRFVIEDSVQQNLSIKIGSKYVFMDIENGFTIDGVKVKVPGEMFNIITNCYGLKE